MPLPDAHRGESPPEPPGSSQADCSFSPPPMPEKLAEATPNLETLEWPQELAAPQEKPPVSAALDPPVASSVSSDLLILPPGESGSQGDGRPDGNRETLSLAHVVPATLRFGAAALAAPPVEVFTDVQWLQDEANWQGLLEGNRPHPGWVLLTLPALRLLSPREERKRVGSGALWHRRGERGD
jgi:hypothetical protein